MRSRFKWRFADEEFVAEDTERPEVDLFVVEVSFDHLRREVVESAAHRRASRGRRVDTPAEVGDLQVALHVQQKVFRLDITVNDLRARTERIK